MDISAKTLTPNESQEYLDNMWDKKYGLGLCYSAMHELKEDIFVLYEIDHKKYYLLHALYDGISSLKFFNQKFQLGLKIKDSHAQKEPKFFNKAKALISALKSLKIKSLSLKKPISKIKKEDIHFQIQLTQEQTKELFIRIKEKKVSSTSFLLNTFNRVLSKKFLKDESVSNWMVPVNMRGKKDQDKRMYSSYIAQQISQKEGYKQTHSNFKLLLTSNQHWGLLYLAKFSLLLGKKLLIKETKKELDREDPKWFASLSNLGDIGSSSKDLKIIPSVRYHRPIGIVCFIIDGKLHIDFNFYHGVLEGIEIEKLKDELQKSITRN